MTRLKRDRGEIKFAIGMAVVGAAAAYGGYVLRAGGHPIVGWTGVVVGGLVAVTATGAALFGKFASCPGCQAKLVAIDQEGGITRCKACGMYVMTRARHITALASDYVAARYEFKIDVPTAALGSFRFPDACSLCCKPATRIDEMLIRDSKHLENILAYAVGLAIGAATGVGFVQTGGHGEFWIPVPYCNECKDAVKVVPLSTSLRLHFRSVLYAQKSEQLNRLGPARAPDDRDAMLAP